MERKSTRHSTLYQVQEYKKSKQLGLRIKRSHEGLFIGRRSSFSPPYTAAGISRWLPLHYLLTARLVPPQSFYFTLLAPTKIGSLRGFVKVFVGFKRKIVGIGTKILPNRRFFDRKPRIWSNPRVNYRKFSLKKWDFYWNSYEMPQKLLKSLEITQNLLLFLLFATACT